MKPRPIRIEGDVAYVPLTRGCEAIIDAMDVPLVAGRNWLARWDGWNFYAARSQLVGGKCKAVYLHSVIFGESAAPAIDHIDGNSLNNRRGNLRAATLLQNAHNAKVQIASTSGLKGVAWCGREGRWQVRIRVGGKQRFLGYFDDKALAHDAYCQAAIDARGDFARESQFKQATP